jgi:hypothetical protein
MNEFLASPYKTILFLKLAVTAGHSSQNIPLSSEEHAAPLFCASRRKITVKVAINEMFLSRLK